MNELFHHIDVYRTNITNGVPEEVLDQKEKELGVRLPEGMRDFYMKFGNDAEIMKSDWRFFPFEDVRIEKDALVFGTLSEGTALIGITMKHLLSPFQSLSYYNEESKKWFEDVFAFSESFFFHISCWQLVVSMESVARVNNISAEELHKLAKDKLRFFSEDKKYMKGCRMLSVYGDGFLGSYHKLDGELYLGTRNGDEVLEKLEEELGLDLDWL